MDISSAQLVVALCHFCEHHGPNSVFHTRFKAAGRQTDKLRRKATSSSCIACSILPADHPGFVTNDPESGTMVVSSSLTYSSDAAESSLQRASFRSLSSEVSPFKEGPLFFSDSVSSLHVLSHTFFLKDSSARGFQRWFSIIILAPDRAILLSMWTTLLPEVKQVINQLQQMAARVYQMEEEHCSHRLLRSNLINANVGAARALQELTGNSSVALLLHSQFSRIVLLAKHWLPSQDGKRESPHGQLRPSKSRTGAFNMLRIICRQLGAADFHRIVMHILRGGMLTVSCDSLQLNRTVAEALQLLVPVSSVPCSRSSHHLKTISDPCLIMSSQNNKTVCSFNNCPVYDAKSSITVRLENAIFCEDALPSFLVMQLERTHSQMLADADKIGQLVGCEPQKVMQFLQSLGYYKGDLPVLQHWSQFCK